MISAASAQAIYNNKNLGPFFGMSELGIYFLENNKTIVSSLQNGTFGFNDGNQYFNKEVKEIEVWKINFWYGDSEPSQNLSMS